MAYIRENPTHAPAQPAMKPITPMTFGAPKSMAARVGGAMHNYLGSFAKPKALMAGHIKFNEPL